MCKAPFGRLSPEEQQIDELESRLKARDDEIEQLREAQRDHHRTLSRKAANREHGATKDLESRQRLAAEIERLRERNKILTDGIACTAKAEVEVGAEIERLQAERDLYERAWMRLSTKTQEDMRAEQRAEKEKADATN